MSRDILESSVCGVALSAALAAARLSGCRKSRRGAVLFRPDETGRIFYGHNHPAQGVCTGSEVCRATCAQRCYHAEEGVITLAARDGYRLQGYELLHIKVDAAGEPVPSGGPSCLSCARLAAGVDLAAVWLLHTDGWRRYPVAEFLTLSLDTLEAP